MHATLNHSRMRDSERVKQDTKMKMTFECRSTDSPRTERPNLVENVYKKPAVFSMGCRLAECIAWIYGTQLLLPSPGIMVCTPTSRSHAKPMSVSYLPPSQPVFTSKASGIVPLTFRDGLTVVEPTPIGSRSTSGSGGIAVAGGLSAGDLRVSMWNARLANMKSTRCVMASNPCSLVHLARPGQRYFR